MILTEGARVRLRMMRREDADELYALLSDEAVMRWLEPPFNRAQAERFLEQTGLSELGSALFVLLFCFAPMDSGWKAAEERTKAGGEEDLPAFVLH